MFWRFGGYANISAIDTLLEKQDVTLEDLLDESDLIQELKQHNTKLIEYLREDKILERLLEYVVAPKAEPVVAEQDTDKKPQESEKGKERTSSVESMTTDSDEEKEKKRKRYSYVSAEILSSDNWSICESLIENQAMLRNFWDFLKLPPPLDPLQASYFTKVNEALLDKKTEEMLDLFKSLDGAVKNMLQHVDSPMVMDLLLKIISLEKQEGGHGIVDWLHSQDLMPILLSFLSSEYSWATQTSAGDFLKAIITISANASQNEQSCIGPNELTRQLVSQPCIERLISDMLKGGNPLTVGVGIIIEVIRKNNSDYDPEVGADANSTPSSRDPIYLGTLLRIFAQRVPDFMDLILSPNHTIGGGDGPVTIRRKELNAAFGGKIEPLGFDRFKTCELMAELLHCSNMGLLNEAGSEEFVKARDQEREKLKAEGRLGTSNQLLDEDLTMKSSTQTRLGSPDGSRKLEVQNASDDDGFEEVTHAPDLGDDAKDDFDEKPEEDEIPMIAAPTSSFLDKDDDDFVDEPLSSPQVKSEEEVVTSVAEPELTVQPLSPSKELAQQVDSFGFREEDTPMTSPPPSLDGTTEETDLSSESSNKHPPNASDGSAGLNRPKEFTPSQTSAEPVAAGIVAEHAALDDPLLAHPEDKPAPLFAKKSESERDAHNENTPGESDDTTMGEAGDSTSSVLMGNTEEHATEAPDGVPATPVVGDFLKIQFVEHRVVPTILDFFFRFPWNNFLHNVVYDVVQQVFNGPMDRGYNRALSIDLFETGNITMRIVDGQKKSDEAQKKNKMRLGYMGHLTLIAEEVVKFTDRHPPELLSESVLEKVMNGEWITYVEATLAETRERDNAILGGVRPDLSVGPRQAVMNAVNAANNFNGSSALAEAGLNGSVGLDSIDLSNGNGTGFTLSGGTLLSGFGSSSDEEDDEMDEDNDEDGSRNNGGVAEFSRYISTPLTTTSTADLDITPPSQPPPPPPPLNIPPSRARRQLAARLALHSKQNAEFSNSALVPSFSNDEEAEKTKSLNPFATDEDDDSENDSEEEFTIGDLEADEEGRGHLPAGTGLEKSDQTLEELLGSGVRDANGTNVGSPSCDASIVSASSTGSVPAYSSEEAGSGRTTFPSRWPFGQSNSSPNSKSLLKSEFFGKQRDSNFDKQVTTGSSRNEIDNDENTADPSSFGVQFTHHQQRLQNQNQKNPSSDSNSDSSNSSDDETFGGIEDGFAGEGGGNTVLRGKRRLSVTTEATRRTSIEDDDDEEGVVHIKLDPGCVSTDGDSVATGIHVERAEGIQAQVQGSGLANEGEDDGDGELVEIQHSEIKGAESVVLSVAK